MAERPPTSDADGHLTDGFSRLTPRTMTGDAVEQIKGLIAAGTLAPGQKLPSERALADMLGVSRPTTREVVRALEAMGVVVSRHGSGTYVTDLSAELLARPLMFVLDVNRDALGDIFAVRVMLEVGAAEAASGRMTSASLAQIAQRVAAMRLATDADSLLVPDLEFHRLIHEASGNTLLLALMDGLRALTRESLLLSAGWQAARDEAVAEHAAIVAALERGDASASGAAMRRHVENAHRRAELARRGLPEEGDAERAPPGEKSGSLR